MGGVVIVGTGQAGYQAADSLRQEGYTGSVTLIGEESHLPYQRPPLSKQYLLGNIDAERIRFRNREYFTGKNINLRLETRVTSLNPDQHEIEFESGVRLGYGQLILATGARVRSLPVAGADSAGVCYLRTLDDVDHIQHLFDAIDRGFDYRCGIYRFGSRCRRAKPGKTGNRHRSPRPGNGAGSVPNSVRTLRFSTSGAGRGDDP